MSGYHVAFPEFMHEEGNGGADPFWLEFEINS